MYNSSVTELDFKTYFPDVRRVSIESASRWNKDFLVLLSIWETEDYNSIRQVLVQVQALEITERYYLDREIKWKCAHGLEDGKYMLGSYARGSKPAVLSLFKKAELLKTHHFYEGYSTEIHSIERTIDDGILLSGIYYVRVTAGSHDEYNPEKWTRRVSKNGKNAKGAKLPQNRLCFEEAFKYGSEKPGNYFKRSQFNIYKYDKSEKLLWEQDTAVSGQEDWPYFGGLNVLAPYRLLQENKTVTDGIWTGGSRR